MRKEEKKYLHVQVPIDGKPRLRETRGKQRKAANAPAQMNAR